MRRPCLRWPNPAHAAKVDVMAKDTSKSEIAAILSRLDQLVEQTQSLQADIKKKMQQQRAEDRSVAQALGSRKTPKRR